MIGPARIRRREEHAIFDLSFSIVSQHRPFEIVAPGFVAASHTGTAADGGLVLTDQSPAAPYAAVELDVADTGRAEVVAGLATARDEHVLALYDPVRGRVGVEVRRDGRSNLVRRKKVRLPSAFRFAFVLCENRVTVVADSGDGWQPLLTARDRVAKLVDLRRPETLAAHRYAWGGRGRDGGVPEAGSAPTLAAARAGLFGMAGIRDPHLVQHSDGRPYVRDGKAYLTCTCAGMGFFRQAHWGVFTLDLADPVRLEQVAQLFTLRDGLVLGDHAGQLVRDDEHDRWIVATSSWGDFVPGTVHVRHTVTDADLLRGVHHLETEPLALPTQVGSWDPAITRIDGAWHVAFVESPSQKPFDFHPALAAGEPGGGWGGPLRLVGAATDLHQCEGPILASVEDRWWLLASDGHARAYPVFTTDMRPAGRLDAPYPTNIPHPQLVPLPEGGHLMVTFDGTQYGEQVLGYGGHGDLIVMRTS